MKKSLYQIIVIVIILTVILIILFRVNNPERKLIADLEKMGGVFYTNLFYKEITRNKNYEEIKKSLAQFKSKGIKADLDNLLNYSNQENKQFDKCDRQKTIVIIYPYEPFGINDYNLKVELTCK